MLKSIFAGLVLAFSVNAAASSSIVDVVSNIQLQALQSSVGVERLTWQVGDSANYNVNMGFIQGTMEMVVASVGADGIWMHQNVDLGFAGKQEIKTLIDAETGAIKKMIVNGKEEQVPDQNIEVISTNQEQVTVPAGTFDSMHVVAREQGKSEDINIWANPLVVPMSGMLKQVAPGPMGEITIECTAFHRN
tara:strand:+ start:3485 stop:4057 length:573 start_codon:yes stop_codon:yes gene_type:complete